MVVYIKYGFKEPSYSSLAQSVEHMTVNHGVVGSSPTGGATKSLENTTFSRLFYLNLRVVRVLITLFLSINLYAISSSLR